MAEGEGIAGSVLEVPTWILAIIFLCLVVFSFLVEVVVHSCTHYFERRGRHGIAKAIMVVVFELTLLGLFGLILEAFSTPISHVCVPYSTGLQEWTFLYNIKGCPCCLADTRGVSLCAQVDRQCLTSYVDMKAYCDCDVTADPASYAGYANASASGRLSEECLPYRQAEAVHFAIDVGRALEVLADATNNSVPTVAELLTEPVAAMASADEGGVVQVHDELNPGLSGPWRQRRRLTQLFSASEEEELMRLRYLVAEEQSGYSSSSSGDVTQMLPMHGSGETRCTGPFLTGDCPDGSIQALSTHVLHQIDVWVFLLALFQASVSVLVICLAELRVRLQWQRWEHQAQQQQETKEMSDVGKAASTAALGGSSDGGSSGSLGGAAANCLEAGQGASPEGLPAAVEQQPGARKFCGVLLKAAAWLREAAICCLQALLPNTVLRRDFLAMRAIFVKATRQSGGSLGRRRAKGHHGVAGHDSNGHGSAGSGGGGVAHNGAAGSHLGPQSFLDYISTCLENDLASFVGLTLESALFVIVSLLLERVSVFGWGGNFAVVLACGLAYACNVALVALLRHRCRGGGQRRRLRSRWWPWRRPLNPYKLLRIPVRLVLFLCSFIFSTTTFSAWQFGPESCSFVNAENGGIYSLWLGRWWYGLVVSGIVLLWTIVVTLPTFSLAVHTPSHIQARLLQKQLTMAWATLQAVGGDNVAEVLESRPEQKEELEQALDHFEAVVLQARAQLASSTAPQLRPVRTPSVQRALARQLTT